jgi:endoglucanase
MNTFRVSFSMERLAINSLTDAFESRYLANLTETINHITSLGAYAVLDPHNYGRYKGSVITNVNAFGTFWERLATAFKSNSRVVFDTNNEYNSMDQQLVFNLNQAAIDAIRRVGATSQWIWVEGNAWTGAWSWVNTNDNMKGLTDPQNKLVYEMHQYLDSDKSGTHPECVSSTIGVDSVKEATQWLRQNGKVGVIGEFAGGPNEVCKAAVSGLLQYLKANSDVWTGALWWAAGPWWDTYMFSYEPPTGTSYNYYGSTLRQYRL